MVLIIGGLVESHLQMAWKDKDATITDVIAIMTNDVNTIRGDSGNGFVSIWIALQRRA